MKRSLLAVALAAVVGGISAQTAAAIPPPVTIEDDGACGSSYREVLRVGNRVVCVTNIRPPAVRVTTGGCNADEVAILVDGRYGVCYR